jgi:hypothetical protein
MSRSTRSGPDDSTARAFARVGSKSFLEKLHRYATGTLHLAAIDAERADVVEAVDLVNTLVERVLDGTLIWALPEHATEEEVVGYACKKLYGMRSTLRRKAAFTLCDEGALDEQACDAPDALEMLFEQRVIADLLRAFEHDAEAQAYIGEVLAGKTRAEIVDGLGCTPERANAVRKRILRGITALDARMNDESEAEPPSSGPRGRHHEPQTTEERQGTPPEPPRGAGRAGHRGGCRSPIPGRRR